MRALFVAMLASSLCLAGCGQAADNPVAAVNPASPTPITDPAPPPRSPPRRRWSKCRSTRRLRGPRSSTEAFPTHARASTAIRLPG